MSFFRWIRNLFTRRRGSDWSGFDAIDQVRVDDSDDWRRQNNDHI